MTILFVDDIRSLLYRLGVLVESIFKKITFKWNKKDKIPLTTNSTITEVSEACFKMTTKQTGALIVFEKNNSLEDFQKNATIINASHITAELILTIFNKNTPLHDGAVIIKNNRLLAAACFLPNTKNTLVDRSYGTRHRAAIGITEMLDCIVVLVSEEKGSVHVVKEGRVSPEIPSVERLISILHESLDQA